MEIKEIRQLIKLMVDGDLSELDVRDGETRVYLRRGYGEAPVVVSPAAAAPPAQAPATPAEAASEGLLEITSPMVGTFYHAESPDSDPLVRVGATIAPDRVVCIVEAMKVMNEIRAECAGTVAEICVENAQPVEFGQVLYRVRPA